MAPFDESPSRKELFRIVPTLPDWLVQVLQVLTVVVGGPGIRGVIARVEAVVQERRGPRVLQPCYDEGRYRTSFRGASLPVTRTGARRTYSNPIRVVLRGLLGFRRGLGPDGELQSEGVLATDGFVYAPATRLALGASALGRCTQSGRLSAYLLYMLAVLIVVLALVPALS